MDRERAERALGIIHAVTTGAAVGYYVESHGHPLVKRQLGVGR